jgi:hypothetical protein
VEMFTSVKTTARTSSCELYAGLSTISYDGNEAAMVSISRQQAHTASNSVIREWPDSREV